MHFSIFGSLFKNIIGLSINRNREAYQDKRNINEVMRMHIDRSVVSSK